MYTLEQIRFLLEDRKTTAVAEATKIHANTIRAIKNGKNDNPTYDVIKKLSDYLEA